MEMAGKFAKWLGIALYATFAVVVVMFLTPVGGWKALDVLTGSMKPAISPGDLVFIHRIPLSEVRRGDIVTYVDPNNSKRTITHRVVNAGARDGVLMVTTKGDANNAADPAFAGGRVVGRVALVAPLLGYVISWLHQPVGLLVLVVLPGLLVIWVEARNLRRILVAPEVADESEGGGAQPAVGAVSRAGVRKAGRRIDTMGPHLLVLLAIVGLLAVGGTYARTTTNSVSLVNNTVNVSRGSVAELLREAVRTFERAIHAANAQLRSDTKACLVTYRYEPVAVYDAGVGRYSGQLEAGENQFDEQVLNEAAMAQGAGIYGPVFDAADSRQALSFSGAQDELVRSVGRSEVGVRASELSQCLNVAHTRYRISVRSARDTLLASIRLILHH